MCDSQDQFVVVVIGLPSCAAFWMSVYDCNGGSDGSGDYDVDSDKWDEAK